MADFPPFAFTTQESWYGELSFKAAEDGSALSLAGRQFEMHITPATSGAQLVTPVHTLTMAPGGGLSLKEGDPSTLVFRVPKETANGFPRGEFTGDVLEEVSGDRYLFMPVRITYAEPSGLRAYLSRFLGVSVAFASRQQPIYTPLAVPGREGKPGATIITGAVPPVPADGRDGDFFIEDRTSTARGRRMWGPKAGGAWPGTPWVIQVAAYQDVPGLTGALSELAERDPSYRAPFAGAKQRTVSSKVGDFGYTPYDYILTDSDREKVRLGAPGAPAVDYAFRAFFADLIAAAGNVGIRAYIPPGVYVFDSAVEVFLNSLGASQRKYCLEIAPGAKFVHSASNRYRFVVLGTWDAAASPSLISSMSGSVGDAYVAITAHDGLNVDLVKSVNVGDHVYRGEGGWQKILCKADYHMQYLDASTNLDSEGNQVVFAGQGREGETYIVGKSGTMSVDGLGPLKLGDEIIHIWGAWRKKTVRGGNFKGYWKPSNNVLYSDENGIDIIPGSIGLSNDPGAPNNAGGTPGDYYIVIGTRGFNSINLGDNYVTSLGESLFWGQGQKVWCRSPGKWHKAFASPTPRGRWNPGTDTYSAHYYPATHPPAAVTSPTPVPAVYSDNYVLGGAGEYGGTYEVTFPGTGTVNGITRNWRRGEYIFYGPNGFEFIPRDPNYDRGIFLFHQDEVTCLYISGTFSPISRDTSGLEGGYSAGIALRAWSNKRAGVNNYGFGSSMFWIKGTLYSESDAADVGDALGKGGIWEKLVEVKNLHLPKIDKYHIRAPQTPAAARKQQIRRYPRTTVCAINFVDSYVPEVLEGNINGSFIDKIRFDSDCFDQDQYSYEGGVVGPLDGASGMTSVYVNRGWRETVAGWRSTMVVHLRDDLFGEFGVKIKGTWGVRVKMDRAILPGGFSGASEFFDDRPAAVMLEDCASVSIDAGIPASGNIISDTQYASILRTRGGVCDISLAGDFGQMDGGVILDLHHNGNDESRPFYWGTPQQYLPNEPGRNIKITLTSSTGLEPRRNKAFLRGNSSLFRGPTIRGATTFTDAVSLLAGLNVNGPTEITGAARVRQAGGGELDISSTNGGANNEALQFRTSFAGTAGSKVIGRFLSSPDAGSGGRLMLDTLGTDGVLRRAIHADANQNVGIGTNAPELRLDVAGLIRGGQYAVGNLPAGKVGAMAFASNGRKLGEAAGSGTGVLVYFSNGAWRRISDDTPVSA